MNTPNYNLLFNDIISDKKFGIVPSKLELTKELLRNNEIKNSLDVLNINDILFNNNGNKESKKLRSYSEADIDEILDYIKRTGYSKNKVAKIFDITYGTLIKWTKKNNNR